jgi:uncharacterized DUF497 family protein
MIVAVSGFDWDYGNRAKRQKHGVSIAEIEAMFARPIAVLPDPAHSRVEDKVQGDRYDGPWPLEPYQS